MIHPLYILSLNGNFDVVDVFCRNARLGPMSLRSTGRPTPESLSSI